MTKIEKDSILNELRQTQNMLALLTASIASPYHAYAMNAKQSLERAIRQLEAAKNELPKN